MTRELEGSKSANTVVMVPTLTPSVTDCKLDGIKIYKAS